MGVVEMRSTDEIKEIDKLIQKLVDNQVGLNKAIPTKLYHYTDILNILLILKEKHLYSRNICKERSLMINDNALPSVINKTTFENKSFVRFYFRPKTPTQYINEGFKSRAKFENDEDYTHCPMPIFLLFDIKKILAMKSSMFVNKNLAYNPPKFTSIKELRNFDFDKIYHSGDIKNDREIIERRHSEVLIPDKCSLEFLTSINCRSNAEKDTLLYLLKKNNIDSSEYKINTKGSELLFNKQRAYVEFVEMECNYIKIGFKNFYVLKKSDDIYISIETENEERNENFKLEPELLNIDRKITMKTPLKKYKLKITINEKIAYINEFSNDIFEHLPF